MKLNIGGMDSLAQPAQTSSGYRHSPTANGALGGSAVDESFIVLDSGTKKAAQGEYYHAPFRKVAKLELQTLFLSLNIAYN